MQLIKFYRKKTVLPWLVLAPAVLILILALFFSMDRQERGAVWLLGVCYLIAFAAYNFRALTGLGARGLRRYARALSQGEQELLYRQYREGTRYHRTVLTESCAVVMTPQVLDAIPYGDIVWVYEAGEHPQLLGLSTRILAVITSDRTVHQVSLRMRDRGQTKAFLDALLARNPGFILGYDPETARLYREDFPALVEKVRCRNE